MRNIFYLITVAILSGCSSAPLQVTNSDELQYTSTVFPLSTETHTPPPTSTQTVKPIPTNTVTPTFDLTLYPYENLNIYEDFDGDELDLYRWHRAFDSPSNEDWIYKQNDGILEIKIDGTEHGGSTQLFSSYLSKSNVLTSFGARMMLSDKSEGNFGFVNIFILVENSQAEQLWTTQCFVAGWFTKGTGKFECQLADEDVNTIFTSDPIPINIGQWYLAMIEIDTESGMISYFLDNQLIAAYEPPPEIIRLGEWETYSPAIGVYLAGKNDIVSGYYDEIRFSNNR